MLKNPVNANMTEDPLLPNNIVPELWYSDGNLIIETEHSSFKVYGGLLAQKSSVFRDMLSFPQPKSHEAVPTVRLFDSTEDLTCFLKAILDPEFFEPPPSKTDLSAVGGIIRLSSKYDVQFLRKRALLHLETTYPSNLEGWKHRDTRRSIPPLDNTPFAVLPLVREFDLSWALPAVLYCICSYTVQQICDGVEWCNRQITINPEDKRKVLIGRAKLVYLQNQLSLRFLRANPLDTGCSSIPECSEHRRRWLDYVSAWEVADPLDLLDGNWDALKQEFCPACFVWSKSDFLNARQGIWLQLPEIFGLQTWDELKGMQEEAMNPQ